LVEAVRLVLLATFLLSLEGLLHHRLLLRELYRLAVEMAVLIAMGVTEALEVEVV
jgi:hypothetical protein